MNPKQRPNFVWLALLFSLCVHGHAQAQFTLNWTVNFHGNSTPTNGLCVLVRDGIYLPATGFPGHNYDPAIQFSLDGSHTYVGSMNLNAFGTNGMLIFHGAIVTEGAHAGSKSSLAIYQIPAAGGSVSVSVDIGLDDDSDLPDCLARGANGCGNCAGMPVWRVSEPSLSLWLADEPLGYQPAVGPRVSFQLNFKQRGTDPGAETNIFSAGKRWNSSWLSYVIPVDATHNTVQFPGGGRRTFSAATDYRTDTRLTGDTNSGFTLAYPDGSRDVYNFIVTNNSGAVLKAFLTERWNAQSQKLRLDYQDYTASTSPVTRLKWVVDGDGKTNWIYYVATHSYSTNLISQVVDAHGRTNSLAYDSNGQLTSSVDVVGLASSFAYDNNGWVTNLTTPYGNTAFKITDPNTGIAGTNDFPNGRSILVTEPDGSQQLYLATNGAPGIAGYYSAGEVPATSPFANSFDNTNLNYRATFHWGRQPYANLSTTNVSAFTANDFRKARMQHWLKGNAGFVGATISLEREPSPDNGGTIEGQKTWHDYAGKIDNSHEGTQVSPLFAARVLPDGSTSFIRSERNSLGAATNEVSTYSTGASVGLRTNQYFYAANDIDLIAATNALGIQVSSNAYNAFHLKLTNYNALNEQTTYTYNTNQQPTSIQWPSGLVTTNLYGADGFVAQTIDTGIATNSFTYSNALVFTHTDARGLTVTNVYDALQRLTRVSYPDATFMTNTWDKLDLVRVLDRMGFTNSFGYDTLRRKIAETNALGYYALYDYCSCGSLNSVRDAAGNYTWFYYDNAGRQTNVVFADGYSVTNTFNLLGQPTRSADSAGTSVTNWFNNQGLVVAVSNAFGQLSSATFDALNRAANVIDANGVSVSATFDNLDRLLTQSYPDGGVEKFGYTANFAAATSYTNQLGSNVVNYAYDALGRKTNEVYPGITTNKFTYSGADDRLTLTDGKNQTTTLHYDMFGRPTNKVDAASNEIFRFTYDPNNRLTNLWTPAKGSITYRHDALGNPTNVIYPVSPALTLQYDALNRMTNIVTAGVLTNNYAYNPVGVLLSEDGPWANDTITYAYTNRLRASLSLQQPSGSWSQTYAYDLMKRLTNITSPAGAFGYQYPDSQPSRLIVRLSLPNTAYITNAYDSMLRLLNTSLKTSSDVIRHSHSYGYNLASQRTALTNTAGDYRNYTYDNAGQLKTANAFESDGTARLNEQHGYAYDPAGNLNQRTNNALVQTFNVDNLNQLSTVNRSGTLTVAGTTTSAATNVTVNALTATRYADATFAKDGFPLVDGTTNFTALAQDSYGRQDTNTVTVDLRATNTFVYDLNGNLTSDGKRGLDYDDENQLIRVTVTNVFKKEFVYDGVNRLRVKREFSWGGSAWTQTNETRLICDGVLPIQHRDANNLPTLTLTRGLDLSLSLQGAGGIGGLLAMMESYGTSSFYHSDGNGNVTALINVHQLLVGKYSYDPFGYPLSSTGPKAPVNQYWFSSELWDNDAGFSHYPRRVYIPALQGWPNPDPIGEEGGLNLYGFVGNNPINEIDPLGLWNLWNPATWGDANPNSWSFGNSLTPWHESSGYTWEGIKETTSEADAAFLDGVIPFADPFKNLYDPCDKSLQWSKRIGEYTRDAELALAGARLAKFRGPEYGRWKDAGQWQEGWHGHFDWGNGLGTHHLPQQTGNFFKNLGAVIKRWWNAP